MDQNQENNVLQGLEADIRDFGIDFKWLSDIQRLPDQSQYEIVAPLLLDHLRRPYPYWALRRICGLLSRKSKAIENAWFDILSIYQDAVSKRKNFNTADRELEKYTVSLANILVKAYKDSRFNEICDLISNPENGESRLILLSVFRRRTSSPKVQSFLNEILCDPLFEKELSAWGKALNRKT